ncbi:MAG: protoporphyrinogen oxidase [bacterium]
MSHSIFEKDVVVIGAGISGLATAYRLQKTGLNVLVLEKTPHAGGSIHTEASDGFLIDYGPNSTLDTSPQIRAFIEEIGLKNDRIVANARANRRYILKNGELAPLPMSPLQFIKSNLFSFKAKLRLMREPFIPPAPADREETIAEFVTRRLGREFLDYAINPFVAGVYAGDPARLSVRSAVAKIYALEKNYGSLIKGAIQGAKERKKSTETAKTKAELFSFKNGMGQLSAALESILAGRIETDAGVESIDTDDDLVRRYSIQYKRRDKRIRLATKCVILTTPAYATAEYVKPFDAALAAKLAGIVYAPVAVVFLGFRKQTRCRPLDGFGFLVPEVEKRTILGCIWSSTLFPDRAPENGAALTTFVGGMRQPELINLNDSELTNLVLKELNKILALADQPDLIKIRRWHKAIPQYELGHQSHLDAIEKFESRHPGLFLSGNFRGGISVGDCMLQSDVIAQKATRFCAGSASAAETSRNVNVLS